MDKEREYCYGVAIVNDDLDLCEERIYYRISNITTNLPEPRLDTDGNPIYEDM